MHNKNLKYISLFLVIILLLSGCFYDENGFDDEGINKITQTKYDKDGYDKNRLDKYGFNKEGIHKITQTQFDENGFDKERLDKNGFDDKGIHKITQTTYDDNGFNKERLDKNGFNKEGVHKFTQTQYDEKGFDINGFNKNNINKNGCFRTELNILCLKEITSNVNNLIESYEKINEIDREINNYKKTQKYDVKDSFESTTEFEERKNNLLKSEYIRDKTILKDDLLKSISITTSKYIAIEIDNMYEYKDNCRIDYNFNLDREMYDIKYLADNETYDLKMKNTLTLYNLKTDRAAYPSIMRVSPPAYMYYTGYIISFNLNSMKNNFSFKIPLEKAKILRNDLKINVVLKVNEIIKNQDVYLDCRQDGSSVGFTRLGGGRTYDEVKWFNLKSEIKYILVSTTSGEIIHVEEY